MNTAAKQLATLQEGLSDIESGHTPPQRRWPELDGAAYHGLAGHVVKTIEPHTEADPAALLVQFLVAFGSVVGRGPHVAVEGDQHHANLFAVLVGETAKGRKGTSWSRIRQLFEYLSDPWSKERIMSGLSSGEGFIWQVRDPITKMQRDKNSGELEEVTVEEGIEDKRLMVLEDEFASTLRVMERPGNTLSPLIRRAWDQGELSSMTKNCPARATNAHISIFGHITADELRRYLDKTECGNGFANRYLFICVRRSKCLPEGGSLSIEELKLLADKVGGAVSSARRTGCLSKTPEARDLWSEAYRELSKGLPGLLGAVTSRAEAQTLRLALVYALLDQSTVIDTPHLMAALAVWDYAEASARYIFGDALGDPTADELYRALCSAGTSGLTRTDISNLFNRNKSAVAINGALSLLANNGLAICRRGESDGPGRPADVWTALEP